MLMQSYIDKQIDSLLLSKVNTKQNTKNTEIIQSKLLRLSKNIKIITADSKDYNLTNYDWLPGGILNAFQGNIVSMINSTKIIIDQLSKQTAYILRNDVKSVLIIAVYRIS